MALVAAEVRRLKVADAEPAAGAASGARGSDERVRAEPEPNADPRVLPGPDVPAPDGRLAPLFDDLGRDEASEGVQPRRLDLEDDACPPQLTMTGGQVQGQGHQQGEERALVPLNRDGMGLTALGRWPRNHGREMASWRCHLGSIRSGMLV